MFEDCYVERILSESKKTPYKKVAIFLHTTEAVSRFKADYDTSLIKDDIFQLDKWIICDVTDHSGTFLIYGVDSIDDYIEQLVYSINTSSEELSILLKINTKNA